MKTVKRLMLFSIEVQDDCVDKGQAVLNEWLHFAHRGQIPWVGVTVTEPDGGSGNIFRFALVDRKDGESEEDCDSLEEAEMLCNGDHAIIEREYQCVDSVLVQTPDGSVSWPPKKPTRTIPEDRR